MHRTDTGGKLKELIEIVIAEKVRPMGLASRS